MGNCGCSREKSVAKNIFLGRVQQEIKTCSPVPEKDYTGETKAVTVVNDIEMRVMSAIPESEVGRQVLARSLHTSLGDSTFLLQVWKNYALTSDEYMILEEMQTLVYHLLVSALCA